MIYPEFLRVRRAITWGVIIISVLLLIDLAAVVWQHFFPDPHTHIVFDGSGGGAVPVAGFFVGISFAVAGIVTVIGCDLARYKDNAELVMTLPISRIRFGVSVIAIDMAGLVVAYILAALLIIVLPFTINNIWPHAVFNDEVPYAIGLGLGALFLWFSLLSALSAWVNAARGAIAGLSWLVFSVLNGLSHAHLSGIWGFAVHTLNYINPMAFLSINSKSVPDAFQIPYLFGMSIVFCIIAIAGWNRQEI